MPYAPTVNDNSGQILAGGITAAVQGLQRGALDYTRQREENKALTSQSKAIETLLPLYAQQAGLPPERIDELLHASPDESPRARLGRLQQTIEGLVTASTLKSRGLQDQLARSQLAGETQRQEAFARSQAETDALNQRVDSLLNMSRQMGAAPAGDMGGRGVLTPQMQSTIDSMAASPAGQLRNAGVRLKPEMLFELEKTAAAHPPKAASTVMQFPNAAALEAKYPAAKYDYQFTENPGTGVVTVPKVSPRAPLPPQPNDMLKRFGENTGNDITETLRRGAVAQATLEQIGQARQALAGGATTGGGAELKLAFAKGVNAMLGNGTIDTRDTEIAKNAYSKMALAAADQMKGQGQITENERKLLASTIAQLGDTPEAANYIMGIMEQQAKRAQGRAEALQQLLDTGETSSVKVSRLIASYDQKNPVDFDHPTPAKASAADKGGAAGDYTKLSDAELQQKIDALRAKKK